MKGTSSKTNHGRMRRWRMRLLAVLISTIVAMLVGELALRLIAPQSLTPLLAWVEQAGSEGLFIPDNEIGWRLGPGYEGTFAKGTKVSINSLGFRDVEYAPKRQNEIRVLSLGDSYAFGHGVEHEQTYAKRLQSKLRERYSKDDINVISGGVDGYNTIQISAEFDRLSKAMNPDFVIATFVAGNDVAENAIFDRQLQTRLQSPVGFIGRHSHLCRLWLRVSFGPRFFIANRNKANIAHTIQCLRELEEKIAGSKIPFLMLIIPARHQVDPTVHRGASLVNAVGADEYLMRNVRSVASHFDEADIPYINLYPVLTNKERATYFDDDSHTNAYGHDLIADAILDKIEPVLSTAWQWTGDR